MSDPVEIQTARRASGEPSILEYRCDACFRISAYLYWATMDPITEPLDEDPYGPYQRERRR